MTLKMKPEEIREERIFITFPSCFPVLKKMTVSYWINGITDPGEKRG